MCETGAKMDWISIGVAAIAGAAGGALGGLIGMPLKAGNLRTMVIVAVAIGAAAIGRATLTPYAEVEYYIRTPGMQPLIRLAPDHVDELKAALREAYAEGGTESDFERAGFNWSRKYAGATVTNLFASKNVTLAAESFDSYMRVFGSLYKRNRVACYDWVEGYTTSPDQLGWNDADKSELTKLLNEVALTTEPENAPLPKTAIDPKLQQVVLDNVKNKWGGPDLDLDGLAKPGKDFAADRKSRVCYTAFAYFTEVQRLSMQDRLRYLQSLFGRS